jgi:acyl-CoA reductase-like NAD-dependent aldehyde dehydrogenase
VKSELWPIVIDGQRRRPSGERRTVLRDPATDKVLGTVGHASAEQALYAIDAASRAASAARSRSPVERADLLRHMADVMEGAVDELAELESQNVGMPITFARATVAAAVDTARFFAGAARVLTGPASAEYVTGMTSVFRREPVGVVTAFIPWNVPLLMAIWKIAPALGAGNAIVVKPSIRTPVSLARLLDLLAETLPPGLLNFVTGDHETLAPILAADPRVAMVALTGSLEAGASIGSLAAPTAKRLHLELGGKTPVLVCADADVEEAASTIARAALDNAGQDCTAASRVLVAADVHKNLVDALAANLDQVVIGDPLVETTELGPVIGHDRRAWLQGMVDGARRDGATVVQGGEGLGDRGAFMRPALIDRVEEASTIARTELFGPVITVERCMDDAEMLSRAGQTPYALAAGIWTRSISRAMRLSTSIDAGKVWINEHHRDVTEMPHGGRRGSGHGSDLSILAIEAYSTPKAIHIDMESQDA